MIKDDVKFAKEQYKLAEAEYARKRQKVHDANKKLAELQKTKAEAEYQVNIARIAVSDALQVSVIAKEDFKRKFEHWKELNKWWQMLNNQNKMAEKKDKK